MRLKLTAIIASLASLLGFAQEPAMTTVKHPDWSRNATIYEVNVRQSTPEGTFKAFEQQLPRLKDLGVDILWFMPIHPISELNRKGTLGSYYAVQNYKKVNPEFGTLADFKNLVDKAHSMGMKVIIDWVPNHTGCDNVWVSTHPEYFAKDKDGKMFGPFDWTDTYKLDYSNPAMREAMREALIYWLTVGGIDGFRCDVAGQVPVDFWDETRSVLQAVKPDLFMLAEASEPPLSFNGFDMSYNWPMKDLFSAIAATSGQYTYDDKKFPASDATAIDALLARQAKEYAGDHYMMNMITNHDLNSWEGTEFKRLGRLADAFAVLSYTLPGMPLIYTGQEVGMDRPFEFFEKDKAPDWTENAYTRFYRTLNALKHSRPELAAGTQGAPMTRYATADPNIYIFERDLDGSRTIVGVNLGTDEQPIHFTGAKPALSNATDIFTGASATLPSTLAPGAYFIFTANK